MLLINTTTNSLVALERKTAREEDHWERDLQAMICRTPGPFFEELGEKILLIGEEIKPAKTVHDRIDLLGIDAEGAAVVLELKRGSNKLHLLQALAYAAMISKWEPRQFVDAFRSFDKRKSRTFDQAKDEIEETLENGDFDTINRLQRIVLIAEAFEFEVMVTADWLAEQHNLDIRCYKFALTKHGNDTFLTLARVYASPERVRGTEPVDVEPVDWSEALKTIENEAVLKFFKEELGAARSSNPKHRSLRFFIGRRRRFSVYGKKGWASVRQYGRFDDDINFWTNRVGPNPNIRPVRSGRDLRFTLLDQAAFGNFKRAVEVELLGTEFSGDAPDEADDNEESPQ